ncbi:MAG TPA: twin-arginine translocase subunit TatC [Candidatus Acidoferrales bacterium]|nr:twin-arginine translocase subunit TatC [Candidatus Acidoferrales bacterium]
MATPSQPGAAQPGQSSNEDSERMSLFEHLTDLRKRLLNSAIAIGIGFVIGFSVAKWVINYVAKPMVVALQQAHFPDKLIFTGPAEYVNLLIKVGFYLGLILALPVVLHQIWLFIAPGLYKHERKAVLSFIFSSVFLFLCGVAFAYFIVLPFVLKFLITFQGPQGPFQPLISISEYFDLILIVMVGLGAIFELPVLIFVLSIFGIVTPQWLWRNFRYAILIITIIAAFVTPTPDMTTMLIFMTPMIGLYFVGIGVSYMVFRRKRQRDLVRQGVS